MPPPRHVQIHASLSESVPVPVAGGRANPVAQSPGTAARIAPRQDGVALALMVGVVDRCQPLRAAGSTPGVHDEAVARAVARPRGPALDEAPLSVAKYRIPQRREQRIVEARDVEIRRLGWRAPPATQNGRRAACRRCSRTLAAEGSTPGPSKPRPRKENRASRHEPLSWRAARTARPRFPACGGIRRGEPASPCRSARRRTGRRPAAVREASPPEPQDFRSSTAANQSSPENSDPAHMRAHARRPPIARDSSAAETRPVVRRCRHRSSPDAR